MASRVRQPQVSVVLDGCVSGPATTTTAATTTATEAESSRAPAQSLPLPSAAPRIAFVVDTSKTLPHIMDDLCLHFQPQLLGRSSSDLALRVCETEELITEHKIRGLRVADGANLKLTLAAHLLAPFIAASLSAAVQDDLPSLKKTAFVLQKYLKEDIFRDEFVRAEGFHALQAAALRLDGNSLAYTLGCIQLVAESSSNCRIHGADWTLKDDFIEKLVALHQTEIPPNVVKPATAISLWILEAGQPQTGLPRSPTKQHFATPISPTSAAAAALATPISPASPASHSGPAPLPFPWFERAIAAFHQHLLARPSALKTLVQRVSTSACEIQLASLQLINAIVTRASEKRRGEFMQHIDSFGVRKAVVRLMDGHTPANFRPSILEFQRIVVMDYHKGKSTPVNVNLVGHVTALEEIWSLASVSVDGNSDSKWQRVGFLTETPVTEMSRIGVLGLATIHFFVRRNQAEYRQMVADELSRPTKQKCPVIRAAIESCCILSDLWHISSGRPTFDSFQPLLLLFEDSFAITLRAFIRLWTSMQAQSTEAEICRVSSVLQSHVVRVLRDAFAASDSSSTVLFKFQKAMLETPYAAVREAHLQMMHSDQALASNPVYIRAKATATARMTEIMFEQRLRSMASGAWFPLLGDDGRESVGVRFCKLDRNRQMLMWVDFDAIQTSTPPDSALTNLLHISQIADVVAPSYPISQIMTGASKSSNRLSSTLVFIVSIVKSNVALSSPSRSSVASNTSNTSNNAGASVTETSRRLSRTSQHQPKQLTFRCKSIQQFGCWYDGLVMALEKHRRANKQQQQQQQQQQQSSSASRPALSISVPSPTGLQEAHDECPVFPPTSETVRYVRDLTEVQMSIWMLGAQDSGILGQRSGPTAAAGSLASLKPGNTRSGTGVAALPARSTGQPTVQAADIPPLPPSFAFWFDEVCVDSNAARVACAIPSTSSISSRTATATATNGYFSLAR
ncbi:ELMO/CED-12 family-domain-containing protein [Entophlyctis helioformis]|nr:ELMO/CED-12 family-domain-containing protein [Entophlyctis helioformis]